ncbi:hypothetical protein FKM82_014527 [Ascaphus truei]
MANTSVSKISSKTAIQLLNLHMGEAFKAHLNTLLSTLMSSICSNTSTILNALPASPEQSILDYYSSQKRQTEIVQPLSVETSLQQSRIEQ